MRRRLLELLVIATLTAGSSVALSGPAAAAPAPSNDNRANAQVVAVPSTVVGTTVGATLETGEQRYLCGWNYRTVWYRVTVPDTRGLAVTLAANGNLDAILDVFKQRRSALDPVACDPTDDAGRAGVSFRPEAGATYYIRVGERRLSESNSFTLRLVRGSAPAEPQGLLLPATGASGTLDRILRPDVAYHVYLWAGHPYRINLARGECMRVELFPPGTTSFESSSSVWERFCATIPYGIYTPPFGGSGRYYIRVSADPYIRTPQPYRLLLGLAEADDVAPGLVLSNWRTRTGSVNGTSLDVVDIYRFDLASRSMLDLRLTTAVDHAVNMTLLNERGGQLACACTFGPSQHTITRQMVRGRYYVVVRSWEKQYAKYYLTRVSRTVTTTTTRFNGLTSARTTPGRSVLIGVGVAPFGVGSATVSIEHFDPLEGWLPYRQRTLTVSGGIGTWRRSPPSVGRWRARTEYAGTTRLAPSASGFAYLLVAAPLSTASRNQIWSAA